MRRALWIASALLIGAWQWGAPTWGANTVYLPDGAVCGTAGGSLDGGWIDGGPLQGFDGGIYIYDAGDGVDAGPPNYYYSAADGGVLWYPDGGPPTDGGFAYGGPSSAALTSDPFPANYAADVMCYTGGLSAQANSSLTLVLVGTAQRNPQADGGLWFEYDGGVNGDALACNSIDGGTCQVGWLKSLWSGLWPSNAVRETVNNSDGGYICCPYSTQ